MTTALASTGMDPAAISAEVARRAPPAADAVELDESDEGRAAAMFLAMDTQWNWTTGGTVGGNGGFGVRIGLKYEVIAGVAQLLGIAADQQLLVDLRTMEAEALKTFAAEVRS